MFYSDGITEATNPADEEYGTSRLDEHVSRPTASEESVLADMRSFANGAGLHDDATVIMIRAMPRNS